ncbi:hypothetical protein NT98_1715 [Bacillus cereus]|nr:hypothetical protein NT98_1715 [Bacillus cereus]
MIQRFIELGEGYSDLYELLEIAKANQERIAHMLQFETIKNEKKVCSLVVILKPTTTGDFQPLYICREGIPVLENKKSKRVILFEENGRTTRQKSNYLYGKTIHNFPRKRTVFQPFNWYFTNE